MNVVYDMYVCSICMHVVNACTIYECMSVCCEMYVCMYVCDVLLSMCVTYSINVCTLSV